jgi:hypothetical protein
MFKSSRELTERAVAVMAALDLASEAMPEGMQYVFLVVPADEARPKVGYVTNATLERSHEIVGLALAQTQKAPANPEGAAGAYRQD